MASTKSVTKKQAELENTPAVKNPATGRHKVLVTNRDKIFWPDEKNH